MAARETRPVDGLPRGYKRGSDIQLADTAQSDQAAIAVLSLPGRWDLARELLATREFVEPDGSAFTLVSIPLRRVDAPQPDPLPVHVQSVAVDDDSRADGAAVERLERRLDGVQHGLAGGKRGQDAESDDSQLDRAHGGEDA